ncbi:hypothetical protein JL475_18635 [Streptomyces sp. M2CJ-2]|nr:hypothetical protein [Streptomyces sp. M2CJ-2]MBL3667970.1 hypothetical protein [Streptomyces sp. M2CJ-2]
MLTSAQQQKLGVAVSASGLGAGHLPQHLMDAFTQAVNAGEAALRGLL